MGQAKPPDLPAHNNIRCPYECESPEDGRSPLGCDEVSGAVRLEVERRDASGAEMLPLWLDVWCPNVMSYLVQRCCEHMLSIASRESAESKQVEDGASGRNASACSVDRSGPRNDLNYGPEFSTSAQVARRLYELADRCVREGKLEKARTYLRQAHLANPICLFGRLAIDRLQELESPSEEPSEPSPTTQEPPLPDRPSSKPDDDERAFRRMRERTMPLGMVEIERY
jgi:hypothetical protein